MAQAHLITVDKDAAQFADTAVLVWRELDAVLTPLLGRRGVAALFYRSLSKTRAQHPVLERLDGQGAVLLDFTAFESLLEQQCLSNAIAIHNTLLRSFYGLLRSLIGAPLTQQLLQPFLIHFPETVVMPFVATHEK